jgi:death-on-curing protein
VSASWRWISVHLAVNWHARLVDRFGGLGGIRDIGLLESALARPANQVAYGGEAGVGKLGALYGVGVAKAHAFIDGNKRIAFAVMVAFLRAHGRTLDATEAEATEVMLKVAASEMDEAQLERWLTQRCRG